MPRATRLTPDHTAHFAATDGGKDHEDKLEEDGKYVPNPRVAYGVFEGPTRFGRRVPGDVQVKEPNGIGPCGEEEIRTAFGAGMWGGKLPSTWEPIDAERYAILAYVSLQSRGVPCGRL